MNTPLLSRSRRPRTYQKRIVCLFLTLLQSLRLPQILFLQVPNLHCLYLMPFRLISQFSVTDGHSDVLLHTGHSTKIILRKYNKELEKMDVLFKISIWHYIKLAYCRQCLHLFSKISRCIKVPLNFKPSQEIKGKQRICTIKYYNFNRRVFLQINFLSSTFSRLLHIGKESIFRI